MTFTKGNKLWDNPNVKKTQFKKGSKPWNSGTSGKHNPISHYMTVHNWLKRHYGKADKCEDEKCDGTSTTYQWALLKGKKYESKRENFVKKCRKCHCRYDNWNKKIWITRRKNNKVKWHQ